jgi:hypothetical protein
MFFVRFVMASKLHAVSAHAGRLRDVPPKVNLAGTPAAKANHILYSLFDTMP